MADTPEVFDVIVMPNLYGDILSDVAAQIAGSVGLAGSANIGEQCAMFEAIHGSAPRRAGQNLANPSGLLLGAVLMLVHIGQPEIAERVHNAWLRTMEDGVHTYDIFRDGISKRRSARRSSVTLWRRGIGQKPEQLKPVSYATAPPTTEPKRVTLAPRAPSELVGVDVYVEWTSADPNTLGPLMQQANGDGLKLTMMSSRGVKVWPGGFAETFCTDSFRCRFEDQGAVTQQQILALVGTCHRSGHGDRQDRVSAQIRWRRRLLTGARPVGARMSETKPLVGVIMGSKSDWETMRPPRTF